MDPELIVHLDGRLLPCAEARLSPFDRGFLFGDGVYEGLRAFGGEVVSMQAHVSRLRASLAGARIEGFKPASLPDLTAELLIANGLEDAFIYWQISRGVTSPRHHLPQAEIQPTVFGYAVPAVPLGEITGPSEMQVITQRDERWLRCDIKSVSLLPVVLAKLAAEEAGAAEALMVREAADGSGYVAEGGSTNLFCVFGEGEAAQIVTPPIGRLMLQGVTRDLLLHVHHGISERPIRREELREASEVILCGTSTFVAAVTAIDGERVGAGCGGPVTQHLFELAARAVRDGTHAKVVYRT
ncbi:MAG: aminotransferase class IV [Phycisphaerales bacterium JB038]